MRAETRMA